MDILFERCAGIDVHKRTVAVCRLTRDAQGIHVAETQTFGTTTGDLPRLSDWLTEGGCTHVGLESTGELWKPVFSFDAVQLSLALADEPVGLLIRLRAGRCFSADPAADEQPKTGRPRRHGAKFVCADPTTWPEPTDQWSCDDPRSGRVCLRAWSGRHPVPQLHATRGTRGPRPLVRGTLIRLEVDHLARPTKAPTLLWFWWAGPRPPDWAEVWQAYVARFAIEHT